MNNGKYIFRLCGVSAIGLLLVKMTYQFKHSVFIFDVIIFGILSLIGFLLLIWSSFTDLRQFRRDKKTYLLIPPGIGLVLTTIISLWNFQIASIFDKPTLIRIYYDGDFNGTAIDFKTDGTYIFENSAIGFSDYLYGQYEISGNTIFLDRNELDNVVITKQLEIRFESFQHSDRTEHEYLVYQIDKDRNTLNNATIFRLVVDNRK